MICLLKRDIKPNYGSLWEIFTLEDKRKEELSIKYAEWRKVEPLIDKEGVDAVLIQMESMKGISNESLLIFNEVKEIKVRYKHEMDEKRAKIEELQKLKWLNKFNFFNLAFEIKDNIPINSLFGGLLGLVLGIGGAYIVTTFLKLPFFYSSYLFLLGFSVAIIVGVLAGIYPARKAALLIPVEALRHQ
jgi:hypothetical protein